MKRLIILAFIIFLSSVSTGSAYIIDTGQPSIPSGSYGWSYHSNPISEFWLAAEFTLDQPSTITDIMTYMINLVPGTATLRLYADGGDVPNVGSILFSQNFSTSTMGVYDWYGLSGLTWDTPAGTYWAAFEAHLKDGFYSCLPSDAPSPMDNYASYNESVGFYQGSDNLSFGLRISGSSQPIPEPSTTMLLLLTGLIGLIGLKKKVKT